MLSRSGVAGPVSHLDGVQGLGEIVQWFEDESYYKRRLIKNRVNKDILLSYCTKLGFAITEAKFWESKDAILFERIQ